MFRSRAVLATILSAAVGAAGCLSRDAISPERAAVERAAIPHDIRQDFATLCKIASERAKLRHPELRARTVACAISDTQTTFKSDTRAVYTVSYVCGIAPWHPKQGRPVATPTIALDVIKERHGWMINGFL